MKNKKISKSIFKIIHCVCAFVFLLGGCSSQHTEIHYMDIAASDALKQINALSKHANDKASIEKLIALHKTVLVEKPRNKASLRSLAQLHTLIGAGFSKSKARKKYNYYQAMRYSEEIMMLNQNFSERVSNGESVWSASDALTRNESDGLGWWSTAMLYYYEEVTPSLLKPINYRLVARSKKMMDQIEKVDPEWEYGSNYFNLAIYYHALPEIAGGDDDISQEYLEKARKEGPKKLLIPWGIAKYFYPTRISYENFKEQLERVLEQDINQENGEFFAWRSYFKRQAAVLLEQTPPS